MHTIEIVQITPNTPQEWTQPRMRPGAHIIDERIAELKAKNERLFDPLIIYFSIALFIASCVLFPVLFYSL